MNAWGALATVVLAVHLTWIVWVIFGWLVARNRPVLRWFHFGSLIYGIFIEIAPWPCPLTLLEQWLEFSWCSFCAPAQFSSISFMSFIIGHCAMESLPICMCSIEGGKVMGNSSRPGRDGAAMDTAIT